MSDRRPTSRRDFIKRAAAGAALAAPVARAGADPLAQDAAAGTSGAPKVRLALIGAGGQGMSDTRAALATGSAELVAAADVYDGRLVRAREVWGDKVFTTRDYQEILARPDVDAVIVATPDHWHVPISVDALGAGKHVYVEKPMVQVWEEGHRLVDAQKKSGKVVQVGSQRVSSVVYLKARDLLKAGAIGELNMVEAWWARNSALGAWQYSIAPDASPATVDWDRFLGRAPKRPFEPIRLFRWRNYQDYGTGVAGDLFVHLFSGIHLITGSLGPTRIMSTGGLRYWKDGRDVPDVMLSLFDYPKAEQHPAFTLSLRVNFAEGAGDSSGFRFVGNEGVLTVEGQGLTLARSPRPAEPGYTIDTFPKAVQEQFLKEYRSKYPDLGPQLQPGSSEVYRAPRNYSDSEHHFRNFFASIQSGAPMVEDAVFGQRAAGPAVVCNLSYFEGRPFRWDPVGMKVANGSSTT
jgi:predicted dehydrogenase